MLLAKKFGRMHNLISIRQLLSTFLYRVFSRVLLYIYCICIVYVSYFKAHGQMPVLKFTIDY